MEGRLLPPEWVDSSDALKRMLRRAAGEPSVALDTEANSFYAYRERTCLIQLSTEESDFLVDPLAGFDLAPLGGLLADPKIVKVFHDGEYDIGILKKDFGFSFANVFDTHIAVMALGWKKAGLATVLREKFGVVLNKKFQRSDWSRRPLSPEQVEYARLDTRFLLPLYRELRAELEKGGRTHVTEGEFRRLERLAPKEQSFDPDRFVRLKGARTLDPLSLQALRELFLQREEVAKRSEVPAFRVLPNETLVQLARARPRDEKGLMQAKGFTWRGVRRFGREMLQAIRRAEGRGPLERIPSPRRREGEKPLSPEQVLLVEKLRMWRKQKAEQEGFDSSHVLKRSVLYALARKRPRTLEALRAMGDIEPWQFEAYGREILDLLREDPV